MRKELLVMIFETFLGFVFLIGFLLMIINWWIGMNTKNKDILMLSHFWYTAGLLIMIITAATFVINLLMVT